MQNIYTEYLDQVNKINKKYYKIYTYKLGLKQKFYISNKKKE